MTTLGKRLQRTTSVSGLAVAAEEQRRQPTRAARGGSAALSTERGAMQRQHSRDIPVTETAEFLKACGRCNRHLGPGRDTFIYMGEVAFCSQECRQKQMNMDELKDKCSGGGGGSDQSGNGSTVAAT